MKEAETAGVALQSYFNFLVSDKNEKPGIIKVLHPKKQPYLEGGLS